MIIFCGTSNKGKLREFQQVARECGGGVELRAVDAPPPEEHGRTFKETAIEKALYYSRHLGTDSVNYVFADDSGLEVDALGGAPGVYSARYAGPAADDAANNAKLLRALSGIPSGADRRARYRCVLVYVDGPDDPSPLEADGTWEGVIVDAPRGTGGFGYDPYFWLPELGMTAAELDPAEKNRLSHRGLAMRALRARLAARP